MQAALEHRPAVGPKYLITAKMPPDCLEFLDGRPVMPRLAGENDGIDGPGRSAANDRERIAGFGWQQFADCLEDANLKGATGAPTGQDQRRVLTGKSVRRLIDRKLP